VTILRAYMAKPYTYKQTYIHMHMHRSTTTHTIIYVVLHTKNLLQGKLQKSVVSVVNVAEVFT